MRIKGWYCGFCGEGYHNPFKTIQECKDHIDNCSDQNTIMVGAMALKCLAEQFDSDFLDFYEQIGGKESQAYQTAFDTYYKSELPKVLYKAIREVDYVKKASTGNNRPRKVRL